MTTAVKQTPAKPLQVTIYREGKAATVVELLDPRIEYVRSFNAMHPDGYLRAEIVD